MKTKDQKIKAIIFDVGGVLRTRKSLFAKDPTKGVHSHVAKRFGLSIDAWFDVIDNAYPKSMEGKLTDSKTISILSNNLQTTAAEFVKLFRKTYERVLKRNNKLYNIINKLKKNFIVGILSDQWAMSAPILIPERDKKIFDVAIISNEVGMRKPNPQIYKLLMKKLKEKDKSIKPSEIVFIDNREYNLKPAHKLGIRTILYKNNMQIIRELRKLGVFVR